MIPFAKLLYAQKDECQEVDSLTTFLPYAILYSVKAFEETFTSKELAFFSRLDSPAKIQAFLDKTPYSADKFYRCPRRVLRDRKAHCFDGALFGAAALWRIGYPPLILDILAERDDEHLLALFKQNGHWGAVAKSNFVGLRFREPVYRTVRELVMSYFEFYYNLQREKTLRGYIGPLNLKAFDRLDWMGNDAAMEEIATHLDELRRVALVTPQMVAGLTPMDKRTFQAGMIGLNMAGVYKPPKKKR